MMTKNLTVNDDKPYTLTLNDVRFDKNTGTIEEYTSDYTNIIIPDNFDGIAVTYIGEYAFYDNALTSVSIPNSVTEIGHAAFSKNALTSVAIPNSVTEIRGWAFKNNTLTSMNIPSSVTSIGMWAFYDNALTSVNIPNSVTEIGSAAFNDNKIIMVNDLPSNGFIYAKNDDGTDNIETIVSYGGAAKCVTIPHSVTEIGYAAFSENALTSVAIPHSVTEIGEYTFDAEVIITRR